MSNRRDPSLKVPEVEPLSDATWQRIERNVMAALDRAPLVAEAPPRRARVARPGWLAAGALAAAAAVAVISVATLRTRSADDGAAARAPTRIVTDAAPSSLTVGDVALTVSPSSALVIDDQRQGGVLVMLERGRVECEVAPRGGRPPLSVLAGDVRVEVVGTRFAVSREGDRAVVEVFHGVVEVRAPGAHARVGAGERWPASAAAGGVEVAAGAPAADEPEMVFEPDAVARPRAKRSAANEVKAVKDVDDSKGAKDVKDVRPASGDRNKMYENAARLEASDPDAVRAIYRELAVGEDAWGAIGLYALARLEEELGEHDRARALLERYLRRFPDGGNVDDARALLDRLRRQQP